VKLEDYKGYEIFVDTDGKFRAKKEGETDFIDDRLASLKERIDKLEKKRIRQPVFIETFGDEIVKGELTSVVKGGYTLRSWEAWVTWREDNSIRREKINLGRLIKCTEKNTQIVSEINELCRQRERLDEKIRALKDQLERLTAKELGYEALI
jgi:hypothetical protein